MIRGLFGPSTIPSLLRGGLEETMQTHHQISQRVAGALEVSSSTDFTAALDAASGKSPAKMDEVDLQREMSTLADTDLRYEAEATLLHGQYANLRTAIGAPNA
jgi:flagellar basal body rod protein FlgB